MSVTSVPPELQQVVVRLDTIIHELENLRRQLTSSAAPAGPVTASLVEQLYGSAGLGTRDEYDPYLDWSQFTE